MCGEKDHDYCIYRFGYWITPACAGKSTSVTSSVISGKDHPRMCGEKAKKGE